MARAIYHKLVGRGPAPVNKLDFRDSYTKLVSSLRQTHDTDRAMSLAVGGEFEAIGLMEVEILKCFGLKENSYLIDVGCGSGRLAKPLSQFSKGRYLGIDVVPDLVDHARRIVERPDWRFEVAAGLSIPEKDDTADFVCFFSVFTHLLHEQSYVYLQEARRVLKGGGKIVFSFLDFTVPGHWKTLEENVKDLEVNSLPLNMFISKDAVEVWAEHLGLHVDVIHAGNARFVPLSKPITFESGAVVEGIVSFGQSVCVLTKNGTAAGPEE